MLVFGSGLWMKEPLLNGVYWGRFAFLNILLQEKLMRTAAIYLISGHIWKRVSLKLGEVKGPHSQESLSWSYKEHYIDKFLCEAIKETQGISR